MDKEGVLLASIPFTIAEEVLETLPKAGDSKLAGILVYLIALGIFGSCGALLILEPDSVLKWYRQKTK